MLAIASEIVFYIIFAGSVAGFIGGLLGLGGGVVMVPCLAAVFHLAGFPSEYIMHLAIGSSLGAMIFVTASSLINHAVMGADIWSVYKNMAVGIVLGTVIGSTAADMFNTKSLAILFGLFLWIVAAKMYFFSKTPKIHKQSISPSISFFVGGISSFFGLGGGIMTLPYLTHRGIYTKDALGISAALSLTIAVVGTSTHIINGLSMTGLPSGSTGFVNWPAVVGISLCSPLFSWLGAKTAHTLSNSAIEKIFAVLLLSIGTEMILHALSY